MSTWQGGYEPRGPQKKPRGPQKKHEGEHTGKTPYRPVRQICDDCGTVYYNLAAHLEECPGKVVLVPPCEVLIPAGTGRTACSLPRGHQGPHR